MNDFKKLVSARFLFTLATAMQAVVLGWQMYVLTHDALYLGLIGLAEAIPALSLALYAGYLVDRSRPLVVYRFVMMGSLISGLVLLFSQLDAWHLAPQQRVLALFVSSFVTGLARGFSQPSLYAIVPKIVPRDRLQVASAWMTSAMQLARITGPALGGVFFGWFGISTAAMAVCVSLAFAIGGLFLIERSPPAPAATGAHRPMKDEAFAGARYVFRHPILLPALSLDMIAVLFGGVTALLPIFASDILHVGPKGLGLLRAAPAVGAVFVSYGLTRANIQARAGRWLLSSVAGFGVCILVFGLSQNIYLSLAALALSGAFDSVSMVIRGTAVQLASPDSMRGKISAVNSIFIGSSNELGELESGIAARLLGTVPSVLFGGVICLATVFGVTLLSPTLRGLDLGTLKPVEPVEPVGPVEPALPT